MLLDLSLGRPRLLGRLLGRFELLGRLLGRPRLLGRLPQPQENRHHRVESARRSIIAALTRIATLTSLDLSYNDIGAEGARSLAAALDSNRILQALRSVRQQQQDGC